MDSIFTPVLAVGINVENVRVGKMTDWDKLILDITTDGTITPEKAFADAVKILIEQFTALINDKQSVKIAEINVDNSNAKQEDVEKEPIKESIVDEEVKLKKRGRPKKN